MGQSSEELLLKITGDSTGGQRSISEIRAELKAAQKDVEDIQKAFAGVGSGANGAQVFQDQLDAAKSKVNALSQELEQAKRPAPAAIHRRQMRATDRGRSVAQQCG
jgi:peptidoglycan hydrolase CwlO-like protein